MDIMEKYTRKLAFKEARIKDLKFFAWIALHGFKKLLFKRWLIIICDMKDFKDSL